MQDQVRTDADARPAAYAKAKVIGDLARLAAANRLTPTAQLIVQYLLTISDPHRDGWSCFISNATLAERMNRNTGNIRRRLDEIEELLGDVVRRTPGRPGWDASGRGTSSVYIIDVRCLDERAGAPMRPRAPKGRACAQKRPLCGCACAPPSSNSEFQSTTTARGVGVVGFEQLSPSQQEVFTAIRALRWWRGAEYIKVGPIEAAELAASLTDVTLKHVAQVNSIVGGGGSTITNPPGLFVSTFRKLVAQQLAQEVPPCRA